jgi:cellobiose phosphorylase
VAAYLRETADFACLDEMLAFYDEGSATLREHCRRAFEVALGRRSPRGLPLILHADWNDGMNAVGNGGKGESVWMAHFLHYLLTEFAALPAFDEATRDRFRREAVALREATNTHAWDGDWYWRATTDDGKLVGSRECREGQIFLNAQTWSVLSGLATPERGKQSMQAARARLYKPYGALLLAPAYSTPDSEIGYLTRYAPGVRENGGVYVHASCWAVLAEAHLGEIDRAYRLWRGFCTVVRSEEPDAYMGEPYVMPGNIEGPASEHEGRGAWTWYTGSAHWYLRALVDGVLGVQATVGGLRVHPGLPDGWESYRIVRSFRGAQYDIRVRRAQTGEASRISVNGQKLDGETLPLPNGRSEVRVEVVV